MTRPMIAFLAVIVALAILGFVKRPWLMLFPVIWAASWIKGLFSIPTNLNKALAYYALEKDAAAIEHHARAGESLLQAGPEFRSVAREAFGRVALAYGVAPGDGEIDQFTVDEFAKAQVAAAAGAVGASRGGKAGVTKLGGQEAKT